MIETAQAAPRPEPEKRRPTATSRYTLAEVARHASEDDCWIIIRGKIYDVSGFAKTHAGGRVVYAFGGRDATDVFTTFHSPAAWKELSTRLIGEIAEASPVSPLVAEFRDLRAKLHRGGLFKSNKAYYVAKVIGNFAILAASIAMLVQAHANGRTGSAFLWTTLSAVVLGLFWQQSGWLAHDFCHHQVFADRRFNDAASYLLGNVSQGFSVDWWKTKHNVHHAAPNELTHEKRAIDPDIDTLPLLAWSAEMLDGITDKGQLRLVRIQPFLFFPVLLLARFNWAIGSIFHAFELARTARRGKGELALLAVHYAWHFGLAFALLPLPMAFYYCVLSQIVSGALLAIVFVQSHNGMEIFSTPKDFVTSQVISTRDIDSGLWNNWFTGGLNYQIEHHLFPTIPRHNLARIREPVRALCEKHGLAFEEASMIEGTTRVLRCLADVAAEAATRIPEPRSRASRDSIRAER